MNCKECREWNPFGLCKIIQLYRNEHEDAEFMVKKYFEELGYEIIKNRAYKYPRIIYRLRNIDRSLHNLYDGIETGFPDFLIWKKTKAGKIDWFVCEVKDYNDGLRNNQIEWFTKHPKIRKIIALVKPEYLTKNPGVLE